MANTYFLFCCGALVCVIEAVLQTVANCNVSCLIDFCLIFVDAPKKEHIDVDQFSPIQYGSKDEKKVFVKETDHG